ncbi:MAG: hypothetical protein WBB36_08385 [Chitinophagales bacterium]
MKNKKSNLLILAGMLFASSSFAQVYSNKVVGAKNEAFKDSIEQQEYPYSLPIWGAKATKKGYQLPYSAGVSVNYLWQESALIIDNLQVGFNNGPKYNLDEIIRFDDATAKANAINVRPDIWLFPFLNVYALFGKAQTSTAISAGVYIPDSSNNGLKIADFSTKAEFNATMAGFGLTPTIGLGGGWLALDMNMVWTDVSALDKPVFTFVFGPRAGKTFKFKKPDRNIALWVGGFRVKFTSETQGSINLSDVLPPSELQGKIDEGFSKLDQNQMEIDEWWNGLTPVEQNNPVNKAKYETANRAMETAGNLLNGLDGAIATAQTSTVQYSLDKQLKDKWNFIVGTQFQLNKHFMIRAEYGFLGSRNQFLTGLQYRFGL